MKKLALTGLIATAFLTSCAEVGGSFNPIKDIGKITSSNPINNKKGTYNYGVIPVLISYDFISQMHQANSYFEKELSPLADKIIYYYYYYLFSPQVLEALANGDNKITGVPISVEVNGNTISTKVNFEYPEELAKVLQYCKSIGGDIKIFIKDEYVNGKISDISYVQEYKDIFNMKSSTVAYKFFTTIWVEKAYDTTLRRFPHIACINKNGYEEFIYAVLPMENLPKLDKFNYREKFMDKYSSACIEKEKGPLLSKAGITVAEGILKAFGKNGCPVYPKYCIERIDLYRNSINGGYDYYYLCPDVGSISGAGLKGIYDAVGVVDIKTLAELQEFAKEINEEEKRKMIQNQPVNFWKCPKESGLSPWVQNNSYCEAVK